MILMGALGSYSVDRATLRSGGQAEVFRARGKGGRSVAIKIAREPGARGAWLVEERELLRRLGEGQDRAAPWIVPVEDHGVSADGRSFVVLPWYDWSLHAWICASKPPLEARLLALEQAISAVIRLHRSPVDLVELALHRDLKPHNFLVREQGGKINVVLADLGTAKQGRWLHATANTGVFTRFYAPIEQQLPLLGAVDASVDVYALAATLYECLCERLPQSLMLRETSFTPLAHELVLLDQQEGTRSPKEEARFQELRRLPVERFFRVREADALTEQDRERLLACVGEQVCGELLPVVEQALAALPGNRLGRPEVLLAATRRARERLGVVPVVEEKAAEAEKRRGLGCWVAVVVALLAAAAGLVGAVWLATRPVAVPPVTAPPAVVEVVPTPAPAPDPVPPPAPNAPVVAREKRGPEQVVAPPKAEPAPVSSCPERSAVFLFHLGTPSPEIRVDGVQVASSAHDVEVHVGEAQAVEIAGPGSSTCRLVWRLRDAADGSCELSVSGLPSRAIPLLKGDRLACGEDGTMRWTGPM